MKSILATYPPIPPAKPQVRDATLTVDTFIAEVPIDTHRSILVYHREHGGRQYIRWRVFHRHRKHGNWYPDKRRAFVVPLGAAKALGHAIQLATAGQPVTAKPQWLKMLDEYRDHRHRCMIELNAPPAVLERERRLTMKGQA
jgi:hypothetical protein